MKKYTFLIVGIILFFPFSNGYLEAQITVNQSDMPSVGSKPIMVQDNSGSLAPQGTGMQTWNYSTLQNNQTNSYLFLNPTTTPYDAYFPSANLADSLIYANGFTYLQSTATSFSALGLGEIQFTLKVALTLHPAFEQISLPATLGTTDGGVCYGDTTIPYSYLLYDSGRAIIHIHYADTIDAYGMMTTPYGTLNVIRQKHYDLTVDSLMAHVKLPSHWTLYQKTTTKNYVYRWYANGLPYYFATMQMNQANTHDSIVQWLDGTNAGIDAISHSVMTSVYPNPCNTEITFNCSSTDAKQISVFDITGRQLFIQEIKNGTIIMNTSAYSAGMYFYHVSNVSGNILDRGKFIVQ